MATLMGAVVLSGSIAAAVGEEALRPATISAIHQSCTSASCPDHDAIVFVHGVFGNKNTFKNGEFFWPKRIPTQIEGRSIDIYQINYTTQMLSWLRRDIATLDEVVYSIYHAIYPDPGEPLTSPLVPSRYRSIGFIAHSLGGNIVAAFLHTVKSELGHEERARYSFAITLGTPVGGAQIANVGVIAKRFFTWRSDPLLISLQYDNTFLRMFNYWRRSEDQKATRFRCRPVHLYAGFEGARMYRVLRVVSREEAEEPLRKLPMVKGLAWFDRHDHEQLAKPSSTADRVYEWVDRMTKVEMRRLTEWHHQHRLRHGLCERVL